MRYAHSLADAGIAASMGNVVAIRTWVDCFNHRRLFELIGYVPPA